MAQSNHHGRGQAELRESQSGKKASRHKLSLADIQKAFAGEMEEQYPPILNVDEAARLLRHSRSTIYAWSSEGRLDFAKASRSGKLTLWRDKLIQWFFGDRGN